MKLFIDTNIFIEYFEDSFQYQVAMDGGCDMFITLNIKDFKGVDSSLIKVLTPQQFVEEYL